MNRLHGLDAARFLAFCGMVLVNFRVVTAINAGSDWSSLITNALEGRAAALFVVLAGVGIVLGKPTRELLLRRAVFLFVIGLINLTIFEADILHFYALYFVVATVFLTASNTALWVGAVGIILLSLIGLVVLDYEQGWDWNTLEYANFWTVKGFLRHSLYNGWHPVFPWAAFALVGMWIGRLQLGEKYVQRRLLIGGLIVAGLALVPEYFVRDPELRDLVSTAPLPPTPFYILAGCGSSAALIGGILLLTPVLDRQNNSAWLLRVTPWLTAPGRQSLTLYVAHIVIGMGTLEALGWMDGSLRPAQVFWFSVGFCAMCSLYARLWALKFQRGPLEALMRRTTDT
ncbi:MAG: DUF418 domain-containing protein [Rhodobacteraceae bacterium]|nr:DUF418 domain-containing protein [Paracoccaceae bacterium]